MVPFESKERACSRAFVVPCSHRSATYLAVNGVAESIHDAAKERVANRDVYNGAGTLDNIAFADKPVITKNDNTNVVGLKVKSHALCMCMREIKCQHSRTTIALRRSEPFFLEAH